jgi:hypothetical protein
MPLGRQRVQTDSATNGSGYRQGLIPVTRGREILVPNGCQTIKDLTGVITDQAPELELFTFPGGDEGIRTPDPFDAKSGRAGNDRQDHRTVPQAVGWSR